MYKRQAYERFSKKTPADYEAFCSKEAEWLDEYTLFMALKDANGGVAWSEWDDALKFRKPEAMEEAKEKYADDIAVSYTHLRAHETGRNLVCRLLLEKKKKKKTDNTTRVK